VWLQPPPPLTPTKKNPNIDGNVAQAFGACPPSSTVKKKKERERERKKNRKKKKTTNKASRGVLGSLILLPQPSA
jgi:hypothetical protein